MKINNISKTFMAALLAVTLMGCSNSNAPDTNTQNVTESEQTEDKVSEAIESEEKNTENLEKEDDKEVDQEENSKEENKEANTENSKEENKETNTENTDQAKETKNTEQSSDPSEDMIIEEREGVYFSSLVASNNGDRSQEHDAAYLSDVRIEDDVLTVDGTIDYRDNPEDRENVQKYEKGSFHFVLSPDVKLQAVGGLADPEYFNKEEFVEYYNKVKDSGLALLIEVKDGVVTTVSISS